MLKNVSYACLLIHKKSHCVQFLHSFENEKKASFFPLLFAFYGRAEFGVNNFYTAVVALDSLVINGSCS